MAPTFQILYISDASDGTGAVPGSSKSFQDDDFYKEKIAEKWAKDKGLPSTGKYTLDRLPSGYGGYAHRREKQPDHVDRYLYGHPNGHFRSMPELYPHFIHLQNFGGSVGCTCKLCVGTPKGAKVKASSSKSNSASVLSSSPGERSNYFAPTAHHPPKKRLNDDGPELPQGRLPSDSPSAKRRKHTDDEGTPDLYRQLIEELRDAGELGIEKEIAEQISPDWRAGQDMLQAKLGEWVALPSFVPRMGELVLFARDVSSEDGVAWDSQGLRRIDTKSKQWLERLKLEVGVVTQMPTEPVSIVDLTQIPEGKRSVIYSGFRVEPLSEPGSTSKSYTRHHKYVPLHAIRPFSFWKELLSGIDQSEWHPTVKHAMTVANSFCVIGRYSFKGVWPECAVFSRGVYIGPELVMVGDTVRLMPRTNEANKLNTDVLVITSIRLRFVKLDQAYEDGYGGDANRTFQSCLHFTGKPFTLDPQKSFNGIAGAPVTPGNYGLPAGLAGYGRWFSMVDHKGGKARIEVPFTRILGRYNEHEAVKAWFGKPSDMPPPPSSFQAVNSNSAGKIRVLEFSQGLVSTREARKYSLQKDTRIGKQSGKSWFWADTRIEQLDLHEVNGRFVGPRDETRTREKMDAWRQALKLLDGKKSGFEHYQATLQHRREEAQQAPTKAFGNMAMGAQADSSSTDAEGGGDDNGDGDEDMGDEMEMEQDMKRAGATSAIELIRDDYDDVIMID